MRTLVVATIALSVPLADLAFNLGVYGTVFFDHHLTLWAITTTTLIALIVLPERQVGPLGLLILAVPTLAIVAQAVSIQLLDTSPVLRTIFVGVYLLALVLAVPYALYVVLSIVDENLMDMRDLRTNMAIAAIAIVVGGTAFLVGVNQRTFLTCDDFEVSGNYVPSDCLDEPSVIAP